MTRPWIANTDIKVIPFGFNGWEKGIFLKKLLFTLKEGIRLLRAPREAYGLLFSDINLKR